MTLPNGRGNVNEFNKLVRTTVTPAERHPRGNDFFDYCLHPFFRGRFLVQVFDFYDFFFFVTACDLGVGDD